MFEGTLTFAVLPSIVDTIATLILDGGAATGSSDELCSSLDSSESSAAVEPPDLLRTKTSADVTLLLVLFAQLSGSRLQCLTLSYVDLGGARSTASPHRLCAAPISSMHAAPLSLIVRDNAQPTPAAADGAPAAARAARGYIGL